MREWANAARKRGDWYVVLQFEGRALIQNRREKAKHRGFKGDALKAHVYRKPLRETRHFVLHRHGAISFVLTDRLPEEDLLVAKRFTDVFDYAYDRFRELKEKERQNRELAVEAALERVRGAALAMRTSDDLEEAANVMFQELQGMALPFERSGINIVDGGADPTGFEVWGWGAQGVVSSGVRLPLDGHPVIVETVTAWRRGEDSLHLELSSERMQDYVRYVRDHGFASPDWPDGVVCHYDLMFSEHVDLYVLGTEPLNPDDVTVLGRFRDSIAFAYGRYLELAAKEAQNRELTIQNAIERVRAQAQGMQESNEIAGVVTMLNDEFVGLGYPVDNMSIMVTSLAKPVGGELWGTLQPGRTAAERFSRSPVQFTPKKGRRPDPTRKVMLAAWEAGEPHNVFELVGKRRIESFLRHAIPDGVDPDEWLKANPMLKHDRRVCHRVFHSHGWVAFWSEDRMSDDDLAVAKRFTDVFDYAYGRFRELEEKEAQNRELTIQNAIERVRAQAQGMQESHELANVAKSIYEEFQGLGYELERTNVWIREEGVSAPYGWVFPDVLNLDKGKQTVAEPARRGAPPETQRQIQAARKRGEWYHIHELEGKRLVERRRATAKRLCLKGQALKAYMQRPLKEVMHLVFHTHGLISYVLTERMSEEDLLVAKRFTEVFDYAYDRFQELKEKEGQNRELTIQNAIERVRAQAQGMQESNELAGVAKAIYDEFQGLGYDLIRTAVHS